MAISNYEVLELIDLMEKVQINDNIAQLKKQVTELAAEKQSTNTEQLDTLGLEFFKLFTMPEFRYLANKNYDFPIIFAAYMLSWPDKFKQKEELYAYLAQKPELCALLSNHTFLKEHLVYLNPDGFTAYNIQLAEKHDNVPFFLIALKSLWIDEHVHSPYYWYLWPILNKALVSLAARNVDMASIKTYLEAEKLPVAIFSNYGKTLKGINSVQTSNEHISSPFLGFRSFSTTAVASGTKEISDPKPTMKP